MPGSAFDPEQFAILIARLGLEDCAPLTTPFDVAMIAGDGIEVRL